MDESCQGKRDIMQEVETEQAAEEEEEEEAETEEEERIKETENEKDNDDDTPNLIQQLEQWFIENPKLPKRVERLLLERFLRSSNNDLNLAQNTIELNYSIRNKYPDIFLNRDPTDETSRSTFSYSDIVPLPCLTPDGYKITIFRLRNPEPSMIHHLEDTRSYIMLTDVRFIMPDIDDDTTTNCNTRRLSSVLSNGEIQLFDMSGFSMQHTARLSFTVLRVYIRFLQTAFPVRIRQIHMINCPSYLNKILTVVRPFLSREVFQLMHFHTNTIEELYEFIPREILPEEYGGNAGKLDDLKEQFMAEVFRKRTYLMDPDYWRIQTS